MSDTLNIYWDRRLAGRLRLDEKRNFIFQYEPSWLAGAAAHALSVRLPLRPEPFPDDAARPFFSNLLPEARIRELIAKGLGVSDKNDFKLLEELGGECAGAISLLREGSEPAADGKYRPVTSKDLDGMIEEMPRRPLLTAKEGMRLSLAGAQNKLPVYVKEGKVYLPTGSYSSSHILKPKIPEFADTVENEVFCMLLAGKCGLPAPEVSIFGGKHRCCLVERYDRTLGANAIPVRLHQEDFCQALGYGYDQKYEAEGGPGLKACFTLLTEHSTEPLQDRRNMLRWVVFNYLIGNCDAHAKNISMLLSGAARLAPFHDLMSTVVYPGLTDKMAMKVGGENRPKWLMKRHWQRFAEDAGVGEKAVFGASRELAETLPALAAALEKEFVEKYGAAGTIRKIRKHIAGMSANLLAL